MAASTPAVNLSSCITPTDFQLALALTITRTKPSHLSIVEHILLLRKAISPSRNENAALHPSWRPSALDAAMYWRLLFEETAKNQAQHVSRISELERAMGALVKTDTDQTANGIKRNANEAEDQPTKRQKTNNKAPSLGFGPHAEDEKHADKIVLHWAFVLIQRLRHDENGGEVAPIIHGLGNLCDSIVQSITCFCKAVLAEGPTQVDIDVIQGRFRAYHRLLPLLRYGIQSINTRKTSKTNHVTYHLVLLFRTITIAINTTAQKCTVKRLQPVAAITEFKGKSRAKKSGDNKVRANQKRKEDPELILLPLLYSLAYRFLECLIPDISPTVKAEGFTLTPLTEGLLHVLLTQAGTFLYTLTFSHARKDSSVDEQISAIVSAVKSTPRLSSTTDANSTNAEALAPNIDVLAAKESAQYLIPLLRLILSKCSKIARPATAAMPPYTFPRTPKESPNILDPAIRRLQNTLIYGMYGPRAESSVIATGEATEESPQHNLLSDILKMPLPQPDLAEIATNRQNAEVDGVGGNGGDDADWFVKIMWDICGWDILEHVVTVPDTAVERV